MGSESVDVNFVEAAGVDRDRWAAVLVLAAAEGANAAHLAKQVMNHLFVELVVRERVFTLEKRERISRDKTQNHPAF